MYVLDLFSGIGGFSLGFERAGARTVAFCETDEHCRSILARRWPDVPIHGDVRDLRGLPLSRLVSRRTAPGLGRIAQQPGLRPDWVVIENVAHTWRRWVPELRRELWAKGYASMPFRVRASNVGAHHERARIFLVANPDIGLRIIKEREARIRELETALRKWRDDYTLDSDGQWIAIPAHQIIALVGAQ